MAVLLMGVATPALASPPTNDDFADADVITTLPFSDSGDLAATTAEADEPSDFCMYTSAPTAWYALTPSASGTVRIDLTGSDWYVKVAVYQSSGTGIGGLSLVGCADGPGGSPPPAVPVTAGTTYYLRAGVMPDAPSHLELRVDMAAPPANDNFADAIALSGAPVTATADLTAATIEPGEPAPSGIPVTATAWYSYTPAASGTLLVYTDPVPNATLAVYSGDSLTTLTELAAGPGYYPPLTFTAQAGTTYYVQAATMGFTPGNPVVRVTVEQPAPPSASFWYHPSFFNPSVYDTVQFYDFSNDPASIGFGPAQWDFGDGAVATGCCPTHRYAADGEYTVSLTVTTLDGRTATAVQELTVRTSDVSIERIQAPNSASVGQTKTIAVKVKGGRYAESVQVQLFKSLPGGAEELVGTRTAAVPEAHGGRSTGFDFTYTFSADDKAAGKVTFRAVANIVGGRDALPADNQAIAPPTEVRR